MFETQNAQLDNGQTQAGGVRGGPSLEELRSDVEIVYDDDRLAHDIEMHDVGIWKCGVVKSTSRPKLGIRLTEFAAHISVTLPWSDSPGDVKEVPYERQRTWTWRVRSPTRSCRVFARSLVKAVEEKTRAQEESDNHSTGELHIR